jgi:hypothetical protein
VGRTVRLLKAVHCLGIRAAEFSCCLGYASKCWMHSGHTFALVKEQQQLIHFLSRTARVSPFLKVRTAVIFYLCIGVCAMNVQQCLLKRNVKDMTAKL